MPPKGLDSSRNSTRHWPLQREKSRSLFHLEGRESVKADEYRPQGCAPIPSLADSGLGIASISLSLLSERGALA